MPGRPLDHHALLREGYELRQGIVASLLARRAEVEPFITGRFDTYCDRMMREGSWGGGPQLESSQKANLA